MNENFKLKEKRDLPEIKATGYLYEHASGASVMHIQCDDENKVFCAAFKTPPYDSTGLPHILEHSVLNGSERYPVKDPFGELSKGSLVTYLNAGTYPDKTYYPVASCNDKDFMNLMGVYLDSVFCPLIHNRKNAFLQEGWHYELDTPDSDLKINGVVYNEMKGASSNPFQILSGVVNKTMFPETQYRFSSGGDPDVIPDLTYENFKDFHKTYYHPSNSFIYFYGDMDIEKCFKVLDEEYLSKFPKTDKPAVKNQIQSAFNEPAWGEDKYPIGDGEPTEGKNYLSAAFVIGDLSDPLFVQSMSVLNYILMNTPASPLKKELQEKGAGEMIEGLFSAHICQPMFQLYVKNSRLDAKGFKDMLFEVLDGIVKKGLDKQLVEACLNRLEFNFREKDFGRWPKGLSFTNQILHAWLEGFNPFDKLAPVALITEIRRLTESDERYFENLIEKHILNNPHAGFVTLLPEPGLMAKNEQSLRDTLALRKKEMQIGEIKTIIDEAAALKELQDTPDTPEALASIPIVELSDIKKEALSVPLNEKTEAGVSVLHSPIDTDGIVYSRFMFDISALGEDEIPTVGALIALLSKLDTKNQTFGALTNEVQNNLGGLSVNFTAYNNADAGVIKPMLVISAKAMEFKKDKIFDLVKEVALGTLFSDKDRIRRLLSEIKADMENAFISGGNQYGLMRAASYISQAERYYDLITGVDFYGFIAAALKDYDNGFDKLRSSLETASAKIFTRGALTLAITCGDDSYSALTANISGFANDLPDETPDGARKLTLTPAREAFITDSKVQYNTLSANFISKGFKYSGDMQVLANALNKDHLYKEIRIKGGAYGYGASFTRAGLMGFFSYRDPHLERTLSVYEDCAKFVEGFNPDDREMLKAILGAVNKLDRPLSPREKGELAVTRHLTGVTQEMAQKERDELLSATPEKIRSYAGMIRACVTDNHICTFGSESKINENKDKFTNVVRITILAAGNIFRE